MYNLTSHDKYIIHKKHFVLDSSYSFGKSLKQECNHSCKPNYLSTTFVYSKTEEDTISCSFCLLFCNTDHNCKITTVVFCKSRLF